MSQEFKGLTIEQLEHLITGQESVVEKRLTIITEIGQRFAAYSYESKRAGTILANLLNTCYMFDAERDLAFRLLRDAGSGTLDAAALAKFELFEATTDPSLIDGC